MCDEGLTTPTREGGGGAKSHQVIHVYSNIIAIHIYRGYSGISIEVTVEHLNDNF